jgi:hypothetical protein
MMLQVSLNTKQITRIFSKVQIDPVTGCWNWQGTTSDGYGNLRYGGRIERTHRVVFAWINGPIPRITSRKGPRVHVLQLDHAVCQNRRCCNPVHLELVTQQVNFLRGSAPNAKTANATRCKDGHLLPAGKNDKIGKGRMTRRCITCRRAQQHLAYLQRKARKFSGCKP